MSPEAQLGKLAALMISVPGGSMVLEKLPNGSTVVGFRFTPPENKSLGKKTSL